MKVVIVYDFKEGGGGVYTHVKNLSIALRRKNIDLHIVGIGDEDVSKRKCSMHLAEEFGFSLHLIRDIDRTLFCKVTTWAFSQCFYYPLLIIKKILELKPDIVHIHGNHLPYPIVGVLMGKFFRRNPLAFTVHGIYEIEIQYGKHRGTMIKRKVNKFFLDKQMACASAIIAVSPSIKNLIAKKTCSSRIYVIPNGINLSEIQSVKLSNHIKVKHPSILFIGRLAEIKGVDILLKGIPIIKKEIPDIYVYVAGEGPLENDLKKLTKKLNIEENVEFLGHVSEDEKYSYFKSVDVCVFPSMYEPFGIVLLEAMACGKPVVASNVGGIPYIVEDGKTGLLFKYGDKNDMAKKVITLLQEKLREKMGKAGLERAKEFSWDKIAEKTLKLYNGVMKTGKGQ